MSVRSTERGPVSPDDWRRLEPLLDAALDLPRERRDAFLIEACHGDAADIATLRQLIDECSEADPLLDRSAMDCFPGLAQDEDAPSALPAMLAGRYRVEHEIGRGGMAIVFLAHDVTHDRKVAVKVMRASVRATLGAERFLSEIRTTAGLRHPHIVPVYDSGETDGLLFFVMPYFDGESLAGRLERERRLPIADALQIAIDIASALEYAHAAGLVHRDIKPSNVLFSSGHALLADFGIARIVAPTGRNLTGAGVVLGTPGYMSPEQQSGARAIDARSDVYSLGCMLYEMLAGDAPASAATRATLARQAIEAVPSLRISQPGLPDAVERCIARAMALSAEDRFASATELSAALGECLAAQVTGEPSGGLPRIRWKPRVNIVAALVVLSAAAALILVKASQVWNGRESARGVASAALLVDSSRYALLPYEYGAGTTAAAGDDERLGDAMRRWKGVTVVDRFQLDDALSAYPTRPLRFDDAQAVARKVSAGRYIRRRLSTQGGTLVLTVSLFDTQTGKSTREATVRLTSNERGSDSAFVLLSRDLLFPDVAPELWKTKVLGTDSRPALQAFFQGSLAVEQWDLARADSQFVLASELDPGFSRARLWIAQVRVWRDMPMAAWRFEAARALTGREQMPPADQRAADVLAVYASGDSIRACAAWIEMARGTREFAAWYGSALCQIHDHVVIRDRRSPSRWRFRRSYSSATEALRHAFQILPAIHREFRASWYWDLDRILMTKPTAVKAGRALAPDTGFFVAYPSWSATGDTLTLVPYPAADFAAGRPWTLPPSRGEAVRHQRALFRDIATTWRAAFPRSADAMLALSIALDGLGEPTALDSLRVARQLAVHPDERLRTAAAEVWMRVKLGVPSDLSSLRIARLLADSLLRALQNPHSSQAGPLASLATLLGRTERAAALARRQSVDDGLTPGSVRSSGQALLAFAAVGGPAESIRDLEAEVVAAIQAAVEVRRQTGAKARWLARPLTLAFPTYQTSSVFDLATGGDALAVVEAAWLRADTAAVMRKLGEFAAVRTAAAPEDLKLEAAYPEAWLLASLGDSVGALKWIAPALDGQSRSSAEILSDVAGAGALVRAMALRASLASRAGNRVEAARWAKAVTVLWENADPYLQDAVVRPMARLVR